MSDPDLVVRNIGRLTTWREPVIERAAVLIRAGRVAWVGPERELPALADDIDEIDAGGSAVLPGLVDCHTHAVWAGSRRDDFVGRVSGQGYQPHGINATVGATRAASYDDLLTLATERLRSMQRHGTTTVEVKSGYGLTPSDEGRLLTVARQAAGAVGLDVETTYLGAHVVPDGRDRRDYVDEVVETLRGDLAASWCDVFCDDGAFTVDEARRILIAAQERRLGLRIHAEQLSHTGAAQLAAELGAASADHLDHVTDDDARALAGAGVVAVLVPVASLYTRSGRWGHGQLLAETGCTLAVATDCNPGTAWTESLPFAMQLACLEMGLSVDAVLQAATLGGAQALRRDDIGHLGVGARGSLVIVDGEHEADLVAHVGVNAVNRTIAEGCLVG